MKSSVHWSYRLLPVVAVVIACSGAVWFLHGDPNPTEMIDVSALGPRFDSVDQLVAASDLVVEGEIVAVGHGRSITDPSDPTVGVATRLVELDVSLVLVGAGGNDLVIEQESALLDGTPIAVNGMPPLDVGDSGVFFLIRGDGAGFPYVALINEQAWAPSENGLVNPVDPDDPVWVGWNRRPINDLLKAVSAAKSRTAR